MDKTKHLLFFVITSLLSVPLTAVAQDVNYEKEFDAFQKKQQKEFNDFKNRADEEFATFLKEAWHKFETIESEPMPIRPEPVKPTAFDKKKPVSVPIQIQPIESETPIVKQPAFVPVEIPTGTGGGSVQRTPILFYGTPLEVVTQELNGFSLSGTGEKSVSDAWSKLCKTDCAQLINDCIRLKKKHAMNDWALLTFVKQIGVQQFGATRTNEIAFLQMFVLNKCGYKARLAKVGDKLKLLVATGSTIYSVPSLRLDGVTYYLFEPDRNGSKSVYTYRQDFANAKNLVQLNLDAAPEFDMQEFKETFSPSAKSALRVTTVVNKNLIDFYKDYPQCDVALHYKTPMSKELKASLYPALEAAIKGKSQKDAANTLINFVQHSFKYLTDGEQFGYEKPNFMDENFFYPACDCEDRAILFANLAKDLLGVDAVLLDYPNHIASAVCFNEDIPGDYILLGGKKYLICDPTYIGAPIGRSMDRFKKVSPEIIR